MDIIIYYLIPILLVFLLIFLVISTHFIRVSSHTLRLGIGNTLKVLHISDIHGKTIFINGTLSAKVSACSPDLVVLTGDLISTKSQLSAALHELEKVHETGIPIFFVPGNYEREEKHKFSKRNLTEQEYSERIKMISQYSTVLINSGTTFVKNNITISLYGFDNSVYGNERNSIHPLPESDIKILLAHSPKIISFITKNKIDFNLLLVGHTHGGQIRLFNRTFGSYKNFHVGLKEINNRQYFNITRGIGTVKVPIRMNCPPEICVFHIK